MESEVWTDQCLSEHGGHWYRPLLAIVLALVTKEVYSSHFYRGGSMGHCCIPAFIRGMHLWHSLIS